MPKYLVDLNRDTYERAYLKVTAESRLEAVMKADIMIENDELGEVNWELIGRERAIPYTTAVYMEVEDE